MTKEHISQKVVFNTTKCLVWGEKTDEYFCHYVAAPEIYLEFLAKYSILASCQAA